MYSILDSNTSVDDSYFTVNFETLSNVESPFEQQSIATNVATVGDVMDDEEEEVEEDKQDEELEVREMKQNPVIEIEEDLSNDQAVTVPVVVSKPSCKPRKIVVPRVMKKIVRVSKTNTNSIVILLAILLVLLLSLLLLKRLA